MTSHISTLNLTNYCVKKVYMHECLAYVVLKMSLSDGLDQALLYSVENVTFDNYSPTLNVKEFFQNIRLSVFIYNQVLIDHK